ncbi:MAG TPA: serine/threonine-protein kinase [Tepidisphaeraceae bacterium]|nr:serine/threonine-protein kinase [Tepidisphaeraceae bacterium]
MSSSPPDPRAQSVETVDAPPEEAAQARPAHKHPEQIGPFRILEKIGEGGMGVVYKAEQREPVRRVVALKVIKLGMDTKEVIARFGAERQALALMSHPNVARVLDAGMTEAGRPYFAMEHVPGIPLTQYCDEHQFTTRQRLDIFIPVCQAVQHAHQKGIIHRDLKPSNILVTLVDGEPVPKVIDFGIAKATNHALTQHTLFTQTGALIGTPEYMSPEQAQTSGLDVDTRTDIFSLGVILYELLTGTLPLDPKALRGAGLDEMARLIKTSEPQKPSTRLTTPASSAKPDTGAGRTRDPRTVQKELRGDLDWIVLKALEKDRSRRYETANALAMDLRRHMDHEPVVARPPSAGYRLQKAFRRNRVVFVASGIVLAALLSGICVSAWQAVRATRAEWKAKDNESKANQNAQLARQSQQDAEVARAASQRMSAGLALDRGLQLCQDGKVSEGMLWMADSLAFNPELDRGFAGVVRLNLAAWRQTQSVQRLIIGHERAVPCVAYSPDRKTVATAAGGTVSLRDASTGESVDQGLVHSGVVLSLAFSADGRLLATGTYEKSVQIWEAATGKPIGQPIAQPDMVNSVEFSRDGRRLLAATGFRDHRVASSARVWDVATGEPVSPALSHPQTIRGGVFTPDGRFAITGGYDGLIRYWDCATWQVSGEPLKLPAQVMAMSLSRDGSLLAAGCNNGEVFVLDVPGRRLTGTPMRHPTPLNAVGFHPDDGLLATGCADGVARLWDWSSGRQVGPPLVHQNAVNAVDFSPDGQRLVTGAEDKFARVWDLPLGGRKGTPLTRGDRALVLGDLDPSLVSARPRTRITGDQSRPIPHWVWEYLCASFSPDGRYVVTGSIDNTARVWEVATGRLVGRPLVHDNWVRGVAFAPDSRYVLTGSHDMTAQLWDVETGEPLGPRLRHEGGVVSVAFSPDGTRALTGGGDKTARLWNLPGGKAIGLPMQHEAEVLSVCFSRDGAFALTGAASGEVRLWDADTALPIGPTARHDAPVTSVGFTANDRSFLSLGNDGAARKWPVPRPVTGDPALVKLWVQTITGQEKDAGKAVAVLNAPAFRERRTRVMESPLAADLDGVKDAPLAWHDGAAGAYELSGVVEPAFWHLDQLTAAAPRDWSLRARRAGVLHRLHRDAEALEELERARALGGLEPVRDWCDERALNLERLHRHRPAMWFRAWVAAAAPQDARAQDDLGHCKARLGLFSEAAAHFAHAVALAPDRVDFQRDLAMARLALDDRAGYRAACARMIELARATQDPAVAQMTALTCVLDAAAVPEWDAVIAMASRAAGRYEGDHRTLVAALFRAGRLDEALRRPWSKETHYAHIVWEWFIQGLLRHRAGRRDEAVSILDQKFKMIDYMDQEMPRDSSSKIWSDWVYHVQCHVLRGEAEAMLRAATAN